MTTLCLDNSFVSDYLAREDYTKAFLGDLASDADDVLVPTIVRFEAYVPAFRQDGSRTVAAVKRALSGFRTVDLDDDAADAAAQIRGMLLDRGEPLGAPDVLIAGIARSRNAEIVSDDRGFERVPDLAVRNPKRNYE